MWKRDIKSFNLFDYRVASGVAAVALLFAIIAPAIAMAAQLTERSIALSSSSKEATGVTYQVSFTAAGDAEATIVDFCENSPVIGQACDLPAGFDLTAATTATPNFTRTVLDSNTIQLTGTIDVSTEDEIVVDIDNVTNPDEPGPLYARIVTYDTAINAAAYDSTDLGSGAVDDGGAAINITETIGVSGAVLETMTFCVSGGVIAADCAGVVDPVVELGVNGVLTPTTVSTGSIYTQITTNAANGAVVSLKSSTEGCGGLVRSGAPASCEIIAAGSSDFTFGEAKFGVKTSAPTDSAVDATGDFLPVLTSPYNNSTYAFNYVIGDATGVTSTFGDPFLDTRGAPVNNKNVQLTFGASVSNNTPAGNYSADLSLIATGKF